MYRPLAVLAGIASVSGGCEVDVECVLSDITLCFDDESWVIDDWTLAVCAFNP